MQEKLVIQLFNGAVTPLTGRDRLGEIAAGVFRAAGLKIRVLSTYPWPWNPFARMHNAFLGLDPLRALKVLVKYRRADLICAHLESCVMLLLVKRLFLFRVPVVIWEVPWSPGWRYREILMRIAIPRAQACVVFSSNQKALIHAAYGSDIPVFCIPFHTDTEFYSPRPGTVSQRKTVWSCGFDAGRDFKVLLEASKGIDATFRIRGPKGLKPAADLHENVVFEEKFLPPDAFRQRYADASVVVICTKDTPNASGVTSLMEALSMGRPTIVSDNPALRDYFPTDDAILIVPVGDAGALRDAIRYILDNPDVAETMGHKARAFAERKLAPKAHYEAMAELYSYVLTGGVTENRFQANRMPTR